MDYADAVTMIEVRCFVAVCFPNVCNYVTEPGRPILYTFGNATYTSNTQQTTLKDFMINRMSTSNARGLEFRKFQTQSEMSLMTM